MIHENVGGDGEMGSVGETICMVRTRPFVVF